MSIKKQTTLNLIEITADGPVQFRIALDIVDEGKFDPDMRRWHRSVVVPGASVDMQMDAVNTHLKAMGWPAVDDYKALVAHCTVAHTPEVVEAYEKLAASQE